MTLVQNFISIHMLMPNNLCKTMRLACNRARDRLESNTQLLISKDHSDGALSIRSSELDHSGWSNTIEPFIWLGWWILMILERFEFFMWCHHMVYFVLVYWMKWLSIYCVCHHGERNMSVKPRNAIWSVITQICDFLSTEKCNAFFSHGMSC